MAALSRLGNDYRPTSAYERGLRYTSRLQNEFAGNISALADAENILVRSLPAVLIRPNCLNPLLPCLHILENCLPGQVKPFRRLLQIKKNY
jgi:hypothetical protein